MRTNSGRSSGHTARIASAVSISSRARSQNSAYLSVRCSRAAIETRAADTHEPRVSQRGRIRTPALAARRRNAAVTSAISRSIHLLRWHSLFECDRARRFDVGPSALFRRSRRSPCHGRCMLALRPACASWIAARAPCPCRNSTIAPAAQCAILPIPRSCGVIRPSGSTLRLSEDQPRSAGSPAPRCTQVPVIANPSVLEYWHMGETAMRFGSVSREK